jgi:hypothetical protein
MLTVPPIPLTRLVNVNVSTADSQGDMIIFSMLSFITAEQVQGHDMVIPKVMEDFRLYADGLRRVYSVQRNW